MGSVASSEVRDATMRRINELELELQVRGVLLKWRVQ